MKKILLIIILTLAVVPFFWFKPGEVNLGGDSSRLYFYEPISYLKNFALYNIFPSQTGEVNVPYFFIPFILLLAIIKEIVRSSYILINLFHAFMLVTSFAAVYASIVALLRESGKESSVALHFAAIVGGLFYALTPVIGANWDKALITHNQVFLNPLIFSLSLYYLTTKRAQYLLVALLLTLLFAPAFSFASAPAFFAFYPLAFCYLFLYMIFVRKATFDLRVLIAGAILFLLLHAFHVFPQVAALFDTGSNLYTRVFTADEGPTFFDNAKGLRLAPNLLGASQNEGIFIYPFFIFPGILLTGILLRGRIKIGFLITFVFFLITLFFDSANISNLGLTFYKMLFKLPGFGMFRNFYGQFMYVFYFFYALTLGYASYYVLSLIKGRQRIALFLCVVLIIIINGWPFIKGEMVNLPVFGAKNITVPFKMDPTFENVFANIVKDPIDGKYLTLPLGFYGYQLLAGTERGLYIGPSIIGYIGGKKDFTGYTGLSPFGDLFFSLVSQGDYEGLKTLLSWLNIRYIFHNVDPTIYDSFLQFPYSIGYQSENTANYGLKRFFPSQSSVQAFIENLGGEKLYQEGTYVMYKTKKYLPHIYITKNNIYVQNFQNDWQFPQEIVGSDSRIGFYTIGTSDVLPNEIVTKAKREGLITNPSSIPYRISLPVEGEYEVYVKHPQLMELMRETLRIESNNQTLAPLEESAGSAWVRFENLTFAKKDGGALSLTFTLRNFNPEIVRLSWQRISQPGLYALSSSIEKWESKRQYLVSFQYNTQGQRVFFRITQEQKVQEGVKTSVLLDQGLQSQGWSQYQTVLSADPHSVSANIQFISGNEELLLSSIKDFAIIPIYEPVVVLRRTVPTQTTSDPPNITFTKINPTKYVVEVGGADSPYTLVFLEAFHKNWKLFLSDSRINEKGSKEIAVSYFDGEVSEGGHGNTFLDASTFETLGKKPIADDNHFLVNGYANAWYIFPPDVGEKKSYTLILEMTSQRLFYLGLLITLPALAICGCWLAVVSWPSSRLRKERKHVAHL